MWLAAVAAPGPNFLVVTRIALLRGRGAALTAVGGIVLGTTIWGLAGLFGVKSLFAAAPMLYRVLQLAGAWWLIVVGVRAIRGSFAQPALPAVAGTAGWRQGLVTSLSNPKSALLVASLFTALLPPDAALSTGLIAVAEMAVISLAWYAGLSLLVSTAAVAAMFTRLGPWIDRVAGAIFIAFALSVIF